MNISCVVPVYNEARRVGAVLDALADCPWIDEVIVVNDGSTDDSESVLKKRGGVHLISYAPNRGKSHAIKMGIEAAKNEWIMMIDSDLVGLRAENIAALVEPIRKGEAEVSLSLRKNSLQLYKWLGLDFVSGERVFRRDSVGDLNKLDTLPGFGLEVYLNDIIVSRKMPIAVVRWDNVITPRKSAKFGWWTGMKGDLKMAREIFSVFGIRKVFRQIQAMRVLARLTPNPKINR